jgi:hypothetical protein
VIPNRFDKACAYFLVVNWTGELELFSPFLSLLTLLRGESGIKVLPALYNAPSASGTPR